jgi:hypothetical protein
LRQGAAFRGQPLLLLAGLLAAWLGVRVALWQPPFEPGVDGPRIAAAAQPPVLARAEPRQRSAAGLPAPVPGDYATRSIDPVRLEPAVPPPLDPIAMPQLLESIARPAAVPYPTPAASPSPSAVIGHSLLLMAGLAQMQVPPAILAYLEAAPPPARGSPAAAPMLAAVAPRPAAAPSRWSADGWLLWREDATSPLLSGRPSYGRSQAGAVIRYRLASESALRPQAYVRVSTALAGAREREAAAGLSARLLPSLPLRFAVEARVGETDRGTRVRPAAFAVTELAPLALPLGARAEAYAQGGYVGGEFATAFADGQARVERPLIRRGEAELSAGAGVWGGAQRDAARLDIGPTAAVTFRFGPKSSGLRGRLAADYRFRVAGDAEPSSGPALTLSAGF